MAPTFTLTAQAEYDCIQPGPRSLWVAVRVEPCGAPLEAERAPLALVLVVDTSGSMGGSAIRYALQSCEFVAELLDARDHLALVTFAKQQGNLDGQVAAFFVMVVAAAEVVVGLAIIMTIFRTRRSASVDDASLLKY